MNISPCAFFTMRSISLFSFSSRQAMHMRSGIFLVLGILFFFCGLFGLWLLCTRRWKTAALYVAAEFGGLGAAYLAFPTMKQHIFSGSRGQQALGSFFDLSTLSDWAASVGRVLNLLGAQFGGAVLWALLLLMAGVLLG